MKKNILLILVSAFFSTTTYASVKTTKLSKITHMYAYDDYISDRTSSRTPEQADIAIRIDTGLVECPAGVYINGRSLSAKTLTTFVLTRYTAAKNIRFQVYDDKLFRGSSSKMCEIDAVILQD